MSMNNLRAMHRAEKERQNAIDIARRATTWYAVVRWHSDSRYRPSDAVDGKEYKFEKHAQRIADKMNLNEHNTYVVRSFQYLP